MKYVPSVSGVNMTLSENVDACKCMVLKWASGVTSWTFALKDDLGA